MSRTIGYVLESQTETIRLYDGSGTARTGEAASVATILQKNGSYSATPAQTVTEVDAVNFPGLYRISFTPDVVGDYDVSAVHATYAATGTVFGWNIGKRTPTPIFEIVESADGLDLKFVFGLKLDGEIHTGSASGSIEIYNTSATLITTLTTSGASDANGIWELTYSAHALTANTNYIAQIAVVDSNGVTYTMEEALKIE